MNLLCATSKRKRNRLQHCTAVGFLGGACQDHGRAVAGLASDGSRGKFPVFGFSISVAVIRVRTDERSMRNSINELRVIHVVAFNMSHCGNMGFEGPGVSS